MSLFEKYKKTIEEAIQHSLHYFGSPGQPIREPVEYALMSGGKRIRPMLVCMMAHGLGKGRHVLHSALAIEFVHTSTLIADDLPCMDNDDERRGRPTVHKAFCEVSALLASYALIPAAYAYIRSNSKYLKEHQGVDNKEVDLAYDIISDITDKNIGGRGVLEGQYEDMFLQTPTPEHIQSIIEKKTSSLFEIACASGWLFGGGDPQCISKVLEFSKYFGLLFQLKDDILDIHRDRQCTGMNYALLFGLDAAEHLLNSSLEQCLQLLYFLHENGLKELSELERLIEYMNEREY